VVLGALLDSPWLRLPLVVIAALAIQTGVLTDMRLFDVVPDIMLVLAIAAGLAAGPERGAILGAVIGFCFDLVLQTPLGLSALIYGLTALGVGLLATGMVQVTRGITVVVTVVASAAAVVAYAMLGSVFGLERAVTLRLVPIVFVVALVNGVLAVPALAVMRWALLTDERPL
jgi:rod shape-determining protein MreD